MAHYYFENTPHGTRKNGTKLHTKTHYDYIFREGTYAQMKNREEDLAFTSYGNIPSWADNPGMFWEEAEIHRDKPDGRAYREFRFALQEEFTLAENMELVERFLHETGIKENHAYSYAIHDKAATFDQEHRNIHCHLMFNEKLIERERPLSANKFFNHYAVNRAGKPTQGYRSSRKFIPKETTLTLRKRWAELVNEKFLEKDLSFRVSEKTLTSQYKELQAAGKNEEAKLLNRIPAPHLGLAYKNPLTLEHIKKQIEYADQATDGPDTAEEIDVTTLSPKEQTVILFANDMVIRQVARQIQQERLRLKKKQAEEQSKFEAAALIEEPFVITTGDVYSHLNEAASKYRKLADDKLAAYKALKTQFLNEEKLRLVAQDQAFDNQYSKAKHEYVKAAKNLQQAKEAAAALYGITTKTHDLAEYSKKIKLLTEERNRLGKQLTDYRHAINGEAKEKIDAIFNALKHANEEKQHQSKHLYTEYLTLKKQTDKYTAAAQNLSTADMDTILFTAKLPATLHRKCKIDGTQPVSKLKILAYKGDSYALLDPLPASATTDNTLFTITAVKIDDPIQRGNVPKYELQMARENNNKWTIHTVSSKTKNDATQDFIRLYKPHKSKHKNTAPTRPLPPVLQAAHAQRNQVISAHISALAERLIAKEKGIRLDAHWNDEPETKDKAKNAEAKMYQGWDL